MILTASPCKKPFAHKGDFFIGKPFYKFDKTYYKTIKNNFIVLDFYTPETLNLSKSLNSFNPNKFLFHPGFIVRNINNTVFRMKLEKIQSGNTYIRILFGTDENSFNKKLPNSENDFELLINSESGALIKKINENNLTSGTNIEFYDTEIRTFFQEQILIDIILHKNNIYLSSVDDDNESSIKIKFPLPEGVKITHIYFDLNKTDNLNIKDLKKINFVEQKYLFNIYVYEKKLLLTPNSYYVETFVGGDYCKDILSYRKTVVEYRCDKTGVYDILIDKVTEVKTCEYKYLVRSKHMCNPIDIMLNKIDRSVAKTRCVVANDNFNYEEEIYFRNAAV
jgi:hypothetical protein